MCGIIGYTGEKEAYPILLAGLEKLEYRGYDSAGIAIASQGKIDVKKKQGRVENLKAETILNGTTGIAHTRWATMGKPSDANAHPFVADGDFVLVHNGIIENYLELKEGLRMAGVTFTSDTDSEVIVHLIAKAYQGNLKEAVLKVIPRLQGAYAFCVLKNNTKEIVGARNGSPLIIGLGEKENFLASDVSAVIEHTKRVIYLDDFQVARISPERVEVTDFNGTQQQLNIKEVNWTLEKAQKQGYKHFMLKEIFEQPEIFDAAIKAELTPLPNAERIIVVACGTANYAGLVGKYIIEKLAKIPVVVEIASEFRYKEPLVTAKDLVIAISQSGETADTLAALRLAKKQGAKTYGVINVVDSTIAREVDNVTYIHAGPEIGVASTKAFMAQVVTLYRIALQLARREKEVEGEEGYNGYDNLTLIKEFLQEVLKLNEEIKALAKKYYQHQNFMYIGRNTSFPLALEGALKLKEISYLHAEAYPAGELKHGPIALISEDMPTVAICPQDAVYKKTFSNIEEIKARSGKVISIATAGDEKIKLVSDDVIYVPKVEPLFYPLIITIPLQLLAYHIADLRECDIDKPRNLAKSCTVE